MRKSVRKIALILPVVLVGTWLFGAEGVTLAPWAVGALIVLLTVQLALSLTEGRRLTSTHGWFAALLVWAGVVAIIRPVAASEAALVMAVGVGALALSVVFQRPGWVLGSRWAVVICGTGAAVVMIWQRILTTGRPAGLFGTPTLTATVVLLGMSLAFFLPIPLVYRCFLSGVALLGIVASASRGALLGVVAVALVWAFVSRKKTVRWVAVVLLALAAVGLAFRVATDRDPLRFQRILIWQTALQAAVSELPLGSGPGGYSDAALAHNFPQNWGVARYGRLPSLAECDALHVAVTLGPIGVILVGGLAVSLLRRLRQSGAEGLCVAAAVSATSLFNSQLMTPFVAWTTAMALSAVLPRVPGRPIRLTAPLAWAWAIFVAATIGGVLLRPADLLGGNPKELTARALEIQRSDPQNPMVLASAEALAGRTVTLRPRYSFGWQVLGDIRLARVGLSQEAALAQTARAAFARARQENPTNVWAAYGEGRACWLLGDGGAARRALTEAVALEPNCAPGWLEMAIVELSEGRLSAAREALEQVERSLELRSRIDPAMDYEKRLIDVDPAMLARVRRAVRGSP